MISVSKESVTQTLDLNDLVGEDISDDEELVLKISQAIIDYTLQRTAKGKDSNGNSFTPYSEDYKKSDAFIAAGKSKNLVTMRLSGDMLGSIDVLNVDGSEITYGIADPDQVLKAFNHQKGDTLPQRQFLGISKEEFKKHILKGFKEEIAAKNVTSARGANQLISNVRGVRTLSDLLDIEDED